MKQAIALERVSSKEQDETGYSLSAQEKFLIEYADRKDFMIKQHFSFAESASGRKQRQLFNEMIGHMRRNDIKILLVEKVDRLTRNFKDAVIMDDWLEEDEERQVHLVKDSLILHKNSRSQEKLNWGIKVLFAKNTTDNLSEEVKKGLTEKLRQGWLPTKPPPGYKTIGEKGHKIHVHDEAQAPLIRRVFEMYASNEYSLRILADQAYEMGLRNSKAKRIYKSRLAEILSDPFYIGQIRYWGMVHPGKHEPLVSLETFAAAQKVLRSNTTPRYRKHFPVFKMLIHREECGGTVTWEYQRGHWYGQCNNSKTGNCKLSVRQEVVEEQLLVYFDKVKLRSPRLVEWIKKALKEAHQDQIIVDTASRGNASRVQENAQKRLDALYDDKLDGKINEDFYVRKAAQYTKERDDAVAAMKRLNVVADHHVALGCNIIDLVHRVREIYLNPDAEDSDRRTLMRLLFSNIGLKANEINTDFTPGFGVLSGFVPGWNEKFEHIENTIDTPQNGQFDSTLTELLRR